jgi:succinate dehydrogenase / fumarate reductase cytochrome b subunit
MSVKPTTKIQRPLSPHLQVYRPQMTSVLSIFHRMAGAALAIGTLMVVWWLVAAASGEKYYYTAMAFAETPLGLFMIFGWSVALFYHMCNGVRHLIWDTAHLMDIEKATRAGYAVLLMTAVLTALVWWDVVLAPSFTEMSIGQQEAPVNAQEGIAP